MAINLPNFLGAQLVKPDYSGITEFFPNILAGKQNQANLEQTRHRNKIYEAEARYAPQMQEALLNAQRQRAESSGQGFSGIVGQYDQIERLKQQYGENNPIVKAAERALALELTGKQNLINLRETQAEGASKRHGSNLNKLELERQDILSNPDIPDHEKQRMVNQIDLKLLKDTTDADTRRRALFASNIDKTIDSFHVDDLVRYAGPAGTIQKKIQESKALTGHESEEYAKYQEALTAVQFLVSQARQFYGESIQSSVREHLESLANPATWANNPALAKRQFEQMKKILNRETETFRGGLQNIEEYRPPRLSPEQQKEALLRQEPRIPQSEPLRVAPYSEEDIRKTVAETGLTENEIKALFANGGL